MCGRFALFADIREIKSFADSINGDIEWQPHYNVSPGMNIPVITGQNEERVIMSARWGFVPHYVGDDSDFKIINAKIETVREKNTFKQAFQTGRCLIPANGFYEWRAKDKQPYYFSLKNRPLMFLAGLMSGGTDSLRSFAILTTSANSIIEPVHHRMPVIIPEDKHREYLFEPDTEKLSPLPYSADQIYAYEVSKRVNNSRNNHPSLLKEHINVETELF